MLLTSVLRMAWRTKKWELHDMPPLSLFSIFLLKRRTQNYYFTSFRKRMGKRVGRYVQKLCLSYHNIGQFILEKLSISKKNVIEIHDTEVCIDSNLSFTIRVLTWGIANDNHICKKNMINLQNISFCLTWSIIKKNWNNTI